MSTQPVRAGLFGAGEHARCIAGLAQRIDGLVLARCFDPDAGRKRLLADECGISPADTLDDLLSDASIQAVIIALPTRFHTDYIMSAARAGRHIYVTRPVAEFLPAARLTIAAAAEAGVILQVGHHERRRPSSRQLKSLIESDVLGRPQRIEMSWPQTDATASSEPPPRFGRSAWPGQDLLLRAVPAFDLAQYLMGSIREVTAQAPRKPEMTAQVAYVMIDFASGCLGLVATSVGPTAREHILIHGTAGSVSWDGTRLEIRSVRSGQARRELEQEQRILPAGTPELDDLCEFVECVRTGARPEVDGETGLAALGVAWMAIASAQHRRPVAIDEELAEEHTG
jgi:myo-inositol 2-dehydrogenase/D-chiro-inositol 1-dehydrogenase